MIRDPGQAFIDRLDGWRALVNIDPETNNPATIFVNAKTAQLGGGEIRLDDGSAVRSDVLTDQSRKPANADRPQQVFTLAWLRVDVSGLRNIR